MSIVRQEYRGDLEEIRRIHQRAFNRPDEANLVDALRDAGEIAISLVIETSRQVVGHILFTRASVNGSALSLAALAPMAVDPLHQHKGFGTLLVRAGIEQCQLLGFKAIIVLGHPAYYTRFGFIPASHFGLTPSWPDVPDEAFMAMELNPGALDHTAGTVRFATAFNQGL